MADSKNNQTKILIYIAIAISIIASFAYFYTQPSCNKDNVIDSLTRILQEDKLSELGFNESDYMPELNVSKVTKVFKKSDSIVCSANVNLKVNDEIAERINQIKNSDSDSSDALSLDALFSKLLKNNQNWNSEQKTITTEITYEVSKDAVSVGNGDGVISIITYRALLMALKSIEAETSKPLDITSIGISVMEFNSIKKELADFYDDVPKPSCEDIPSNLKRICKNEKILDSIWYARRISIWAEENATKRELDHKISHPYCNNQSCKDLTSIGEYLRQSISDSGHGDWIK